ncbi:MAG: TetR/AcrR family transcriptional regulator [Jatrophihabitantaceae bacterium]
MTDVVHGVLTDGRRVLAGAAIARRTDGRSLRWSAHRIARREELIDAAISAIGEHGAAVGMDQIAAAAGTSKPVIYRYFADKTDLYRAVSQRVVGQVLDSLMVATQSNPSPRQLIHASVEAYLVLLEANPELYRFVSQNPLIGDTTGDGSTDFGTVVAELLAQQLSTHLAAGGLNPALAHPWGEAIVGFIRAASIWWLDNRAAMTRAVLTDYLAGLLWSGAAGIYQQGAAQ